MALSWRSLCFIEPFNTCSISKYSDVFTHVVRPVPRVLSRGNPSPHLLISCTPPLCLFSLVCGKSEGAVLVSAFKESIKNHEEKVKLGTTLLCLQRGWCCKETFKWSRLFEMSHLYFVATKTRDESGHCWRMVVLLGVFCTGIFVSHSLGGAGCLAWSLRIRPASFRWHQIPSDWYLRMLDEHRSLFIFCYL